MLGNMFQWSTSRYSLNVSVSFLQLRPKDFRSLTSQYSSSVRVFLLQMQERKYQFLPRQWTLTREKRVQFAELDYANGVAE